MVMRFGAEIADSSTPDEFLLQEAGHTLRHRVSSSVNQEELGVEPIFLQKEPEVVQAFISDASPPWRGVPDRFQWEEENPGHAGKTIPFPLTVPLQPNACSTRVVLYFSFLTYCSVIIISLPTLDNTLD